MLDLLTRPDRDTITGHLDEVEDRLPAVPAAVFRAQRATARLTVSTVGGAGRALVGTAQDIGEAVGIGVRTVTGTVRSATRRTTEAVEDEVIDLADRATVAADRAADALPDETWTKEELYELARELDVDGRSSMSKGDLLEAVRHTGGG